MFAFIYLLSHCDKTINVMLLLSVVCYLIVINLIASSILSYVHYNGLSEMPKK